MEPLDEILKLRQNLREIDLGSAAGYKLFHYPFNQPNLRFQASKDGIMVEFKSDLKSLLSAIEDREIQKRMIKNG